MSALIEHVLGTDGANDAGPQGDSDAIACDDALRRTAARITAHATFRFARHADLVVDDNVRIKPSDIAELMALIRSQGLLENLVCYDQMRDGVPTGKQVVAAGKRRTVALGLLIAEGSFPDDYAIPYLLVTEDEAIMVGLAENLGRVPMHPADVFAAMLQLAQRGRSAADIALAFGLEALTVRRRLKLANVAPRLFALYRDDQVNYEQMAALAVCDDQQRQLSVWDSLDSWSRSPQQLKRLLTAQEVNVRTDRVARFVGSKPFLAHGGQIRQDLLSDQDEGYIEDVALLEQLANTKLQRAARKLDQEGWAWIDISVRIDEAALAAYGRVRMVEAVPSAEQALALEQVATLEARLEAEQDALADDDAAGYAALAQQLATLRRERTGLLTALRQPDPQQRALAGAVVTIDPEGALRIIRDLLRPADCKPDNQRSTARKPTAVHSERLTGLLTAHRTLALRAELVRQPEVALLVLAHQLLSSVFYPRGAAGRIVQLHLQEPALPSAAEQGAAWDCLAAQRSALLAILPGTGGARLMEWLRRQPRDVVRDCIAFCTACAVNALQTRERPEPAFTDLARTLGLDMRQWWQPTAADYFAHLSKARMMEVVSTAVSPLAAQPLVKLGKQAAAEAAARAVAASGWLPEPLRAMPAAEQGT